MSRKGAVGPIEGERAEWLGRIADAVGTRVATAEARHAFADELLRRLQGALPLAARAEYELDDAEQLERLARAANRAAQDLVQEIKESPEGTRIRRGALGSTPIRRGEARLAVERAADTLAGYALAAAREASDARKRSPRRRGPRNAAALYIAEQIADLYVRHFDRQPAHSSHTPMPFDRICGVITELFTTRPVAIGGAPEWQRPRLTARVRARAVQNSATRTAERRREQDQEDQMVRVARETKASVSDKRWRRAASPRRPPRSRQQASTQVVQNSARRSEK